VRWIRLITCDTLQDAETDQRVGPGRQAAGQRGESEGGDPDPEDPAEAVPLPQPRAGDQQDGIGDRVAGDDQLQGRPGRVQIGADDRGGDIDDEDVQDGHELADQDQRQQEAGPGRRRWRRTAGAGPNWLGGGRGCAVRSDLRIGHATSVAVIRYR
jgi:hypothetical protein